MPSTEETLTLVSVLVAIITILVATPPSNSTIAIGATQIPTVTLPTAVPTTSVSTDTIMPDPNGAPLLIPGIGSKRMSERDGMVQLYIPAGRFLMGSAESDLLASGDEKPQHNVYLEPYWIDRVEVTNAHYVLFLNDSGSHKGLCDGYDCVKVFEEDSRSHIIHLNEGYKSEPYFDDYPVMLVSWYGAKAYCEWAGRRLPTEAEWEKAARGTDGFIYPWGDEFDCKLGNFAEDIEEGTSCDGRGQLAPAGSFPDGASPYGVLDMAGNVWEWVADWYDGYYYVNRYNEVYNPIGPIDGTQRVMRGGAWYGDVKYVRAAERQKNPEVDFFNDEVGFRCAQSDLPTDKGYAP